MMEALVAAWDRFSDRADREPGASPATIEEAQRRFGRPLPQGVVDLYRVADGGSFAEGNLAVHPLLPDPDDLDALALTTASDRMRSWEWPVPDELVLFGGDGGDGQFGLWMPAGHDLAQPPVVELGETFDEPGLAVVGDDLMSFLRARTAYYVLLIDVPRAPEVLDGLGVPDALRARPEDCGDDEFNAILRWASPGLPDPEPDPYERSLTPAQVTAYALGRDG